MIPLVLLAGFLGAGKTRFLTDLIPLLQSRGIRVRVILNDFENANIDATRLSALDALVTPLNGECMCCTSLTELLNTLYDVPADPGSVMLIEANGATETDELISFLTQEPKLSQFTLPLQLTVVDAPRWQKRWFHNSLEAAQTRTATHVQLNWTHKAKPERLAVVDASLRELNPRATATTPVLFAEVLGRLVESVRDIPRRAMTPDFESASSQSHQRDRDHAPDPDHAHHHDHDHKHSHTTSATHSHPFASASLALPPLVDRDAFRKFVSALPEAVVRAKGIVYFRNAENKMYVWSKVQGRKSLQLDEVPANGVQRPSALFIGAGLPLDTLAAQIAALATELG